MSLHDVAQPPPEQAPAALDEISSPISAQIFEFCDPDFFTVETIHNSEVTSNSNCCYEDQSSYTANFCYPSDLDEKFSYKLVDISKLQTDATDNANNSITTTTFTSTTMANTCTLTANNCNLSIIFDSQEEIDNDISASIDFSPSPPFSAAPYLATIQHDQLDFTSQLPVAVGPFSHYSSDGMLPLMAPQLPPVCEEDCLSAIPPFLRLNPQTASCSFLDPFFPGQLSATLAADCPSFFTGTIFGSGQELDYQGDNTGIFCPDKLPSTYNSGDMQPLNNESQQLASGAASSTPSGAEISLEDPTFKVGKLSVEERREKIHRYMKKRNERNFSKKIKYACRKTLADSRPRVRGRFAKNDDFGESRRHVRGHHDEDDYEEVTVKEEDEMVDYPSTDIYAHIGDVNSFKCGYPIQYWT
ncbi:hypothetical protein Dimus_028536 [Dionaea muscipula]